MGDTAAMWGDMLGLGPLMKAVSDPTFHDQIRGFLGAMQATHALAAECIVRCDRLERKLDALLRLQGINPDVEFDGTGIGPAIPAQHGADGAGGHAVAAGARDNGAGGAAAPRRLARG
jgi:hypothetical protein